MALRDLVSTMAAKLSLSPAARVTGTSTGTAVDLRGYDAAVVVVTFGAYTDGTHTPSLQHSTDGSTYTTVTATDLQGSFAVVSSVGGANSVQSVGYIGSARYVRVVMTVASATTGALSSASVIAGMPRVA
ncbi:MAG: hypothetical protein PHW63_01000 [Alphaproteobacteria bacterium]|nr:hypothetical protein [Alphaproteobacteria bacterium]